MQKSLCESYDFYWTMGLVKEDISVDLKLFYQTVIFCMIIPFVNQSQPLNTAHLTHISLTYND